MPVYVFMCCCFPPLQSHVVTGWNRLQGEHIFIGTKTGNRLVCLPSHKKKLAAKKNIKTNSSAKFMSFKEVLCKVGWAGWVCG